MADSNQERAWVLGAFATIGFVATAGIVGSVYSAVNQGAIFGFCVLICASIVNTLTNKLAAIRADLNAEKASNRLSQLEVVTEDTNKTGQKVHVLVNSNMAKALKAVAAALRTVATLRPSPENEAAAEDAEAAYAEHEKKQKIVDVKEKKDSEAGGRLLEPQPPTEGAIAHAQETARDAQATAKDAQAVAKTLTEESK